MKFFLLFLSFLLSVGADALEDLDSSAVSGYYVKSEGVVCVILPFDRLDELMVCM